MNNQRLIEILNQVTGNPNTFKYKDDVTCDQALNAMQRAVEEETATLRAEVERLRGLLRELTMRTQSAFPENEQDNEWFDSELKGSNPKFLIDLFDVLQLGRDAHRPPMGKK